MVLIWPGFLALLAAIPLLATLYILALRRRRRSALRYSSLALVRAALPRHSRLRQFLPPALFLLAVVSLAIALARPATTTTVPVGGKTVVLALDISESMEYTDIQPSRISAMKTAALAFVRGMQPGDRVGIVTFSTDARLVLPPTTDPEALASTISSLTTAGSTAIGNGIETSLTGVSETNPPMKLESGKASPTLLPAIPVTGAAYKPQAIVLLTDGVSNHGTQPLIAARQAVRLGVPVFTIAYGSGLDANGNSTDPMNSLYWVDTDTLKAIAVLTGGKYYSASSADALKQVFSGLPATLFTEHRLQEVSVIFAGLGALLASTAVMLSLLWHPLP